MVLTEPEDSQERGPSSPGGRALRPWHHLDSRLLQEANTAQAAQGSSHHRLGCSTKRAHALSTAERGLTYSTLTFIYTQERCATALTPYEGYGTRTEISGKLN